MIAEKARLQALVLSTDGTDLDGPTILRTIC